MIYQPSEDSYLLASIISKYVKNKSVLDVGAGSGILAETAKKSGAKSVLAVDINSNAIKLLKQKNIPAIKSNLFSKIKKNKKFDFIFCNPPYLPEDKREDKKSQKITTGGKKGDEFILKFIKQAENYLNKNGKILLLLSSFTPRNKIISLINKSNLNYKIIISKNLFFETLEVWEVKYNNA
ncbi:MAG: HemK2/MTQ2 family protein methyltransferase [Nanoarchaeota archaeon]